MKKFMFVNRKAPYGTIYALESLEVVLIAATFDLDDLRSQRRAWGLFRDRRPDLYGPLLTLDGTTPSPGAPR